MMQRWWSVSAVLWILNAAPGIGAPPVNPAPAPTLAKALATTAPPPRGLVLAVDAGGFFLPKDAIPPDSDASVAQVALAFGDMTQDFGEVTAVAPATIAALNPDPHDPNIYDGMAPSDVIVLLAASLADDQWKLLTGENGLSLGDLTTDDQRHLFVALFPGGKLTIRQPLQYSDSMMDQVFSVLASGDDQQAQQQFEALDKATRRDVSDQLPQARLRLGQHIQMSLSTVGKPDSFMPIDANMTPGTAAHWEVMDRDLPTKDTSYGVPVRATVPNAPKDGDLDFDINSLQAAVPVTRWKTVGELIAAVARASKMELYVDRRWERKPLTSVGAQTTMPAHDLLRALALCLGGTYRKVGPAYVLTYETTGVGTIRQRWSEFQQDADAMKAGPVADAADQLYGAHSPHDLVAAGDPLALTANQEKKRTADGTPSEMINGNGYSDLITLPFAQLTAGQKAYAGRAVDVIQRLKDRITHFAAQYPDKAKAMGGAEGFPLPALSGNVQMTTTPEIELLLPSLDQPVKLNSSLRMESLFQPSNARREAVAQSAPTPAAPKVPPPGPPVAAVLKAVPRRAVLAHPRTLAEVDALVKALRRAGMNALYLDVFSDGQTHLQGSPDILDEALERTQGTGIAVYPTVDLFTWGEKAPEAVRDLNILGETYPEARGRLQHRTDVQFHQLNADGTPKYPGGLDPVYVSPSIDDVRQTLTGLTQDVSARPGVAGLVWRDAAVPGTTLRDGMDAMSLGYTESSRLAFLRHVHVDPCDVSFSVYAGRVDLSLPGFDGGAADGALQSEWQAARVRAHRSLLESLFAASRPLTILVERGGAGPSEEDWFGSWDSPTRPLPAFHYPWENQADGASQTYVTAPAASQARSQSRLTIRILTAGQLKSRWAGTWLQDEFRPGRWDGFVLDAGSERVGASSISNSLQDALTTLTARVPRVK